MLRPALALSLLTTCATHGPPPPPPPPALGPFVELAGGATFELAPGEAGAPIVALYGGDATWWDAGAIAPGAAASGSVILDTSGGAVAGARWVPGHAGRQLRVGLGTLDLAAKTYAVDPALRELTGRGEHDPRTLEAVAWLPDGNRVAILLGARPVYVDRRPGPENDRTKYELVIASLDGRQPVVRKKLVIQSSARLAAGDDRILVVADHSLLFDAAGTPVPAALPDDISHARFSAGTLAITLVADSGVTLLDPHTGALQASWALPETEDAVAVPHGVVALGRDATVRIGCVAGAAISPVAQGSSGTIIATRVEVVGDKIAVAADKIRVATFANPCK